MIQDVYPTLQTLFTRAQFTVWRVDAWQDSALRNPADGTLIQIVANQTTVRTEVLAGVTTFLTMAYIIVVQPAVLSGKMFGTDTGFGFQCSDHNNRCFSGAGALGTSTVTSFIESAAGVEAGGRTSLTGLVVAALFLVALFLAR